MKFLNRLVHWILPEWYQPGSKRMSLLLTMAWGVWITFGLQIIYFVLFSISGFTLGTIINILSFIFCALSAALLKHTKRTDLSANILVGIIFFNTLINSYFTGGLHSSILLWIFMIPIVSIFILKRRHGLIWVVGTILGLTLFFAFFPDGSPESIVLIGNAQFDLWFNLIALLGVIWLSAVVIDNSKNRAISDANQASEKIAEIARELETELEQRKLVELALRESEERLDLAIRGADLGLWDWNLLTDEITRSEKSIELLGQSPEDLNISYNRWIELIHPEDQERVREAFTEHLEGFSSIFRSEHRVQKQDGDWLWVLASGAVTSRDEEGCPSRMVGVTLDITDKKLYEVQLQHLANTDALTGLVNRRHFFELAQIEFDRAQRYHLPMSIAMLDIDHFKTINDQYGHLVGDHVLFQFSRLFRHTIRNMDLLARYGGEEFVILFPHTDRQEALESAERIRAMIEETSFQLKEGEVHLTISMGIATFSERHSADLGEMLEQADKALYLAKDAGRNRVAAWDIPEEN